MRQEFWVAAGAEHGQCAEARGAGGMVAASRALHSPVILLLQRMRHKARVRVVASEQCASGSTLLCVSIGGRKAMVAIWRCDGDRDGDVCGRGDSRVLQQVTGSDTRCVCVCAEPNTSLFLFKTKGQIN